MVRVIFVFRRGRQRWRTKLFIPFEEGLDARRYGSGVGRVTKSRHELNESFGYFWYSVYDAMATRPQTGYRYAQEGRSLQVVERGYPKRGVGRVTHRIAERE